MERRGDRHFAIKLGVVADSVFGLIKMMFLTGCNK